MRVDPAGRLKVTDGDRVARVSLLRVAGRDGRGAYMGEIYILDIGTDEMPLRNDIVESIRDLSDALDRHGFMVSPLSLPTRLVYGGAWAPGALEEQIGYDPLEDPKTGDACRRFFHLLWANLPRQWLLKPAMVQGRLKVVCLSPNGLMTAVYDKGVLSRAAKSGHLDKLAFAASRMFLNPPPVSSYRCPDCSRELPDTPSAGRCPECAAATPSPWDSCSVCGLPPDGPPGRSCVC